MSNFVTRAYNKIEVDHIRGIVHKSSTEPRLYHESRYYQTLQGLAPKYSIYFPRYISRGVTIDTHNNDLETFWLEMEYLHYPTLAEYVLGKVNVNFWWDQTFQKIHTILSEWDGVLDIKPGKNDYTHDMYIKKTESEYEKFKRGWSDQIGGLFQEKSISVNNRPYLNFEIVWPNIRDYIEQNMLPYKSVWIHGDCCFSNILYSGDVIRFIDPRGSFGKIGIFGDRRYDIAKLYHSVDGKYEHIINDEFVINRNFVDVDLQFKSSTEVGYAKSAFENAFFPKYNKKEMKILQGCIYIGMCARHYDSLNRQIAMYVTGVRLLNEALEL